MGDLPSMTGTIPDTIASLVSLKELELGEAAFTGSLTSDMFDGMTTLETLRVFDLPNLTLPNGTIPAAIWNLDTLTTFEFSKMGVSGNLPSLVAKLSNLETLVLSDNGFSGPLPNDILNLTSLQTLDIGGNMFSGNISDELWQFFRETDDRTMEEGMTVDILPNDFSGTVHSCVDGDTLSDLYGTETLTWQLGRPSASPTESPSASPTQSPTHSPSQSPITSSPTQSPVTSSPTTSPTSSPVTDAPSSSPVTGGPTASPTTVTLSPAAKLRIPFTLLSVLSLFLSFLLP